MTTRANAGSDVVTPSKRRWWTLSVLVLAVVMLAVDATVLSLAIPSLTATLEPTAVQMLWIGDVYSFGLAGLLIVMGCVADRYGRRRTLLIGSVVFGVASVAAGFAPSAELLIVFRAMQGVAAATLMPSTLSIIRSVFPDARERTTAVALWAAAAAGGAAAGPVVGGFLLEHYWWGSVFVVNAPIVAVLVLGTVLLVPESRDPDPGAIDPLSVAASLVGILGLVFAVKQLASHGPDAVGTLAAMIGLVAGYAFFRRQRTLAASPGQAPMIDTTLLRIPAFAGSITATFLSVIAFSGLLFFFAQYLQLVRGYGTLEAGLRILPLTLSSVLMAPFAGRLARRWGYGRSIGAGLTAAAIGLVALAATESSSSFTPLAIALVMVGLGEGLSLALNTDACLSAVPPNKAGAASGMSETAYELGVAIGIALLGSALTAVYRSGLPADAPEPIRESLASASADTPAATIESAVDSFVRAMQSVSVLAAAVMAVAAVVAVTVIDRTTTERRRGDRRAEGRGVRL
ncbi:MAG: MFS transporter [Rhodococcus sp. (in: high G+C Gram-positive bacteria)]